MAVMLQAHRLLDGTEAGKGIASTLMLLVVCAFLVYLDLPRQLCLYQARACVADMAAAVTQHPRCLDSLVWLAQR